MAGTGIVRYAWVDDRTVSGWSSHFQTDVFTGFSLGEPIPALQREHFIIGLYIEYEQISEADKIVKKLKSRRGADMPSQMRSAAGAHHELELEAFTLEEF